MSELPTIDPIKVATRETEKLRKELTEVRDTARNVETQLEILAEALRDERDEATAEVSELKAKFAKAEAPVVDITSLPA